MMQQPKRSAAPQPSHNCPACHHPQVKLQRRLSATTLGATIYVCPRVTECSVGINVAKIENWVAV